MYVSRFYFFFSSRRRHTRFLPVSWARRCVQETGPNVQANLDDICLKLQKLLEIYEKGLKLDPTNYKPPLELLKFLHTISQQHPTKPFYTRIMTPYLSLIHI
eukprot:TRINITY_DN17010_c0_g1_i1.p2 TRINITY_DN17010_c0_g1~~TRINITY_DN17010_c0_g1_i1.p2  ORF type:complete len:102 (-),score=10.00 TRINITY_DN17010_c0_g1_i1:110-415(-)